MNSITMIKVIVIFNLLIYGMADTLVIDSHNHTVVKFDKYGLQNIYYTVNATDFISIYITNANSCNDYIAHRLFYYDETCSSLHVKNISTTCVYSGKGNVQEGYSATYFIFENTNLVPANVTYDVTITNDNQTTILMSVFMPIILIAVLILIGNFIWFSYRRYIQQKQERMPLLS